MMMVKVFKCVLFYFIALALTLVFNPVFAQAPAPGTVTFKYQNNSVQTNSYSSIADFVPGSGQGQDGGYGYQFITQGTGTTSSFYTQVSFYVFNAATNDAMISFDRNNAIVTIQAAFIRSAATGAATTQGLTTKPAAGGPFKMQSVDLMSINGSPTVSIQAYNDGVAVGSPVTGVINTTTKTTFDFSANANFYSIDEIGITGFNAYGVRADNLISTNAVVNTGSPAFSYVTPQVYTASTAIAALYPTTTGGAVGAFSAFTTFTTVNTPIGVATDAAGNVYVTDQHDNLVYVFNSSGVNNTGSPHAGKAGDLPYDIVLDGLGHSYIANSTAKTVSMVTLYSNTVVDIGGFTYPVGLAVDVSNNIYVTDLGNGLAGSGAVYKILAGTTTATPIITGLNNPSGIAVNSNGDIYIAQYTLNTIIKAASGTLTQTAFVSSGLNAPYGMKFGPAGNLYLADQGSNTIKKVTTAGLLSTVNGTGLSYPYSLAYDGPGNMYITNNGANTVLKSIASGYTISATLPAGLVFNNYSGAITGTPTATSPATNYTVTATNAQGNSTAIVNIAVNPAAPVFTYATPQVYTVNTAITSLSPTNTGGTVVSYAISPALPAGLNFATATGIISGTPTAIAAATNYTVTATNVTGSSTAVINIAVGSSIAWTAGLSTSVWATAGNWSTGVVPGVNDAVSIGVVAYTHAFEPTISTANFTVSSITFGAAHAGTLTVSTGRTLTLKNNLTVNTGAAPILTGTGTGAVNIAPGAIVNIAGTGVLTITSPLNFTLQSTAAGSASIGQVLTTSIKGTGANAINVQRYITGGSFSYRGYRLLSSPVTSGSGNYTINYLLNSIFLTGTKTQTTGGFDNTSAANPTLYLYRENMTPAYNTFLNSNFRGINNLLTSPTYGMDDAAYPTTTIPIGNGFLCFFRGSRSTVNPYVTTTTPLAATLTATGMLNTGQVIVKDWFTASNLSYTTGSPAGVIGYNLVGNPYASSINWDTFQTAGPNTTGIYGAGISLYTYTIDPKSHNFGVYIAGTGGKGTNNATNIIPSGQGFFVLATGINPQLIFNESAKSTVQVTSPNLLMGAPADNAVLQYLRLELAKDSVNTDDIILRFSSTANTTFNPSTDAPYKPGNGLVGLSSFSSDNRQLAINAQPFPRQSEAIRLKTSMNSDGMYRLNMDTVAAVPPIYDIWLMDAYKKDSLDMRNNKTYAFNVTLADTNTYGDKRFSLIIRQNPALGVHLLNFTAAHGHTGTQVAWTTENEQNYTNFTVERSTDNGATFNVLGGYLSSAQSTYSFLDKTPVLSADQYRLKIEDLNGAITYSNIVSLMYANSNSAAAVITLFPNPAGSVINVIVNPAASNTVVTAAVVTTPVYYEIKITNIIGTTIMTSTSLLANWQTDVSGLTPGTYFIQVTNKSKNSVVGSGNFIKL